MHLHLVRVSGRPKPLRPAKVVVLEARRQARIQAMLKAQRPEPSRPAA